MEGLTHLLILPLGTFICKCIVISKNVSISTDIRFIFIYFLSIILTSFLAFSIVGAVCGGPNLRNDLFEIGSMGIPR